MEAQGSLDIFRSIAFMEACKVVSTDMVLFGTPDMPLNVVKEFVFNKEGLAGYVALVQTMPNRILVIKVVMQGDDAVVEVVASSNQAQAEQSIKTGLTNSDINSLFKGTPVTDVFDIGGPLAESWNASVANSTPEDLSSGERSEG